MKTTTFNSGLFCNHLSLDGSNQPCKGRILRKYSEWVEYGDILGPNCPRYKRSSDDYYCERCGGVFWPEIIIQRVKSENRKLEIISEDLPPAPVVEQEPHVDLFRLAPRNEPVIHDQGLVDALHELGVGP